MKSLWFPMSATLDGELDCWASPVMLRMPLSAGKPASVRYLGDQMWPSLRHGETLEVHALEGAPRAGDVLVAAAGGTVELWRVLQASADRLRVAGDACPGPPLDLDVADVLGVVRAPRVTPGNMRRTLRRGWLELREARLRHDERPAASVRAKYDSQAANYARRVTEPMPASWDEAVRRQLGDAGRVLVIGSGTGRECHGLAKLGFSCLGIDFAPRMVDLARRLAADAGLDELEYEVADIRRLELEPHGFAGVLFTPDVYSFLPGRDARAAVLRSLRAALAPGGRILLSARVTPGGWARTVLAVQWLLAAGRAEAGDSHTRFLEPDGSVHRSFVHCFSARSLRAEYTRAGFALVAAERAFQVLEPDRDRGPNA